LRREDTGKVIQLFEGQGYISREGILEAFPGSGMFNFIHQSSGLKVDFWVNRGEPFTESCFARARKIELMQTKGVASSFLTDDTVNNCLEECITPAIKQMNSVMPGPDQVRDDGSGIQCFPWIPAPAPDPIRGSPE
jgi:hypothetical protein